MTITIHTEPIEDPRSYEDEELWRDLPTGLDT